MNQGYLYETLLQASYKKGYANQEKEIGILTRITAQCWKHGFLWPTS